MDTKLIFMTALGLILVISPLVLGIHHLKKWLSESQRLERRIRDIE
jgi:hypothetical protein